MSSPHTPTEFEVVATALEKARDPEDVFGALTGSEADRLDRIKVEYRALTLHVHPDRHRNASPALAARAATVFAHLTTMKGKAEDKVRAGSYGNRAIAAPTAAPPMAPITVESARWRFEVTTRLFQGDYCDIYACARTPKRGKGTAPEPCLFKVVQAAADNDLLEHEATILGKLFPKTTAEETKSHGLLPRLLDTLRLGGKGSKPRQVNILSDDRDHFSLVEVHRVHPVLDYRDAVWMVKRALMVLGLAHRRGVIHGAVLPPHLLVHPVSHAAKLLDWSYAAETGPGGKVKALIRPYTAFYPPEVPAKQPLSPATDLFMLAKCAVYLLGGDPASDTLPETVPEPIRDFLRSALLASPSRRPHDAWSLHEAFDALLRDLVGKPVYRPLDMPART